MGEDMIPLTFTEKGNIYIIRQINGKDDARRHLNNLGFIEGEEVSVISEFGGNLIVAVKDSRIALNRGMASRIVVE